MHDNSGPGSTSGHVKRRAVLSSEIELSPRVPDAGVTLKQERKAAEREQNRLTNYWNPSRGHMHWGPPLERPGKKMDVQTSQHWCCWRSCHRRIASNEPMQQCLLPESTRICRVPPAFQTDRLNASLEYLALGLAKLLALGLPMLHLDRFGLDAPESTINSLSFFG